MHCTARPIVRGWDYGGSATPPPPGSVKSKVSRGFLVRMGIEILLKKRYKPPRQIPDNAPGYTV